MQVESAARGLRKANRLGGVISLLVLVLCILIFLFRLGGMSGVEQLLGIVFLATAIPIAYLLFSAGSLHRSRLYYIQIGAILTFILLELLLDYILKIEFRSVKWMTVLYVMFFFAGTGGLIGIASLAGKRWSATAIVLFLLMTLLAFWQRGKTGM
jgi:hypothetical protein